MNQRPFIARGLAVSAVSALVVTGLTCAPAHAVGPDVAFISIFNAAHRASTRLDSDLDRTITLTAAVDDTDSPTVSFEYNTNPAAGPATAGWTNIGSVTPAGGFVTLSWDASGVVNTSVAVRVNATTPDGTSYAIRNGVSVTGDGSPVNSVKILGPNNDGYFAQPYADSGRTRTLQAVNGTTSATGGTVALSWWRASDKSFQGRVDAAVSPMDLKVTGFPGTPTYTDGGGFSGALDITAFGADPGDVLVLAAERDTDDAVPVTLYSQTPTSTSVAVGTPRSTGTPVEITIRDQDGLPIAGAEVRRMSDSGLVGYTDGAGIATANQPGGTSETYYANTTDTNAQDGADPVTAEVTAGTYVPVPTGTVARFTDGDVFDDDEYAAGDVALQVVDQEGTPFGPGAQVGWALYPTGSTPPASTTATADSAGRIVIPFDPAGADGSYTLSFTTPTGAPEAKNYSTTFVAGESTLSLTPGAGTAVSGGQISYTGTLSVGGQALPGRAITLTYKRGRELAPGRVADAGLGAGGKALAGSTVTGADGSFTVLVDDPAKTGKPTETGGLLTAATAANAASGSATLTGNAAESAKSSAEFGKGKGKVKVKLIGSSKGAKPDQLRVTSSSSIAGESVVLYKLVGKGKGKWKKVLTRKLDKKGSLRLKLKDTNGKKKTSYKVVLRASSRVQSSTSNVKQLP